MKKERVIIASMLVAGLTQASIIYSNNFTGAAGSSPASSAGVDPGIANVFVRTELDGTGHLTSKTTYAGDCYLLQLAAEPITKPVKLTATVKTPQDNRFIAIGFQGEWASQLYLDDCNGGPFLRINSTSFDVKGGTGLWNGTTQSYTSQYAAGSVNTFEMTYYPNGTVDVFLNGSSVVTGLQINHEYPAGTPSDPVIKFLQMQFYMTATDGTEPWIDEVVVEVIPEPATLGTVGLGGLLVTVKTSEDNRFSAIGLPGNYLKSWNDPALKKRIEDGIEKNRKSDVELTIIDAAGKSVSGAKVKISQQSHAFLFGANMFVLGQMEEKEQAYRDAFLKLFNAATIAFYWRGTEPEQGRLRYAEGGEDIWRRPPPDRVVAFCKEHGLAMRGHPLLWYQPNHNPTWLPKDPEVLKELYIKRFREIAERYADDIPIWDAVNESQAPASTRGGVFPLSVAEEGNFQSFVPWAFNEIEKVFRKDNELHINELSRANWWKVNGENPYYQQCTQLIADGIRIDGIGFQFHFFTRELLDKFLNDDDRSDPNRLIDLYERFSGIGPPLHITEITIGSEGDEGELVQARVVRDMYRLWFSIPKMAGITWWNYGDGTAHGREGVARGGLTDENFQPKLAYHALDQLINHDWKTNLETRSDEGGRVSFRGFHGDYSVIVSSDGKTKEYLIKVSADGATTETLILP